jgi:probable F420-dependent oxidoreductase
MRAGVPDVWWYHRPVKTELRIGMVIRVMGPQSTRETIAACAHAAEAAGVDEVWISDHIAIPPDDAEGSGGRYLDPLATLAFLAARTERVRIGTSVLNLPYRPALPTAKAIATIQELSGGRVDLGVGLGWMEPEFKALGVERSRRGALTDETLEFIHRCFASDEVEANGQPFLFLPRPARPPIFVGGAPPHAFRRVLRFGEGWMPMIRNPEDLAEPARELRRLAEQAGKPPPEIVALTGVPSSDPQRLRERVQAFERAGATRLICGTRYADADEFRASAEALSALLES